MTLSETPLPEEAPAAEPAPAPPERRGLLAVLLGVIAWPRSTFTYLRDHGGRSWLLPLAVALALTLAVRLVAVPIEKAQAEAAQKAFQDQLDALQNDQNGGGTDGGGIVTFNGPVGGGPISFGTGVTPDNPLASYGLPLLGVLGDWVLRGGALLVLAWVLGGRPSVGGMFRMSGWTLLPDIARLVVTLGVMLAMGTIPVRGLNAFAPGAGGPVITVGPTDGGTATNGTGDNTTGGDGTSDSGGSSQDFVTVGGPGGFSSAGPGGAPPILLFLQSAFFGSLDVYLLWTLLLMAIGVAVTARLGWLKAGLATLLFFGLSVVLAALPALFSFYLAQFGGPGLGGGPNFIGP